jgi:hypothetical protein
MVIGENMLQEFITQNYLIIEQNIVTNICVWDGDTSQWTPPQGSIAIVQATTPAKVWVLDKDTNTYILQEQIGVGQIGFTWDGSVLTTNEPQPKSPVQPVATGTQVI